MGYDYARIWNKIERLPWCALVTTGRNGSDYFQSLLDGHPEVFVFNGYLPFHSQFWKKSHCADFKGEIEVEDLVDEFIGMFIYKLKSKYDHVERKDQLGDNMQEYLNIDIFQFRKYCVNLAKLKPISSKYFLQAIYTAYALCLGQDIDRKKLFFHHIHHILVLGDYLVDFPGSKIISMTRDPRASYVSGVESWRRFNPLIDHPRRVFFVLKRIIEDAEPLKNYPNEFRVLRVETLENENVLKGICKWLDISFDPCLKKSTWGGLRWWGDRLSILPKHKDQEEFSKAIRRNKWKHKLNKIDKLLLDYLLADRLKLLEYEFEEKKGFGHGILMWFGILLPTTYEKRHLSPSFQIGWLKSRDYKNMLFAFYCYFKRIILFNKLFYIKHFKKATPKWLRPFRDVG